MYLSLYIYVDEYIYISICDLDTLYNINSPP